ncbi:MAG: nuclear transport factor 2 family protein, partial [Rhodospirillaceae bacterium]|nr:nuclear transport factor 2 family protein [Rhodospirillaceae bacterium]
IAAYLGPRPNAPPSISSFAVSNIRVRPVAADVALAAWELDYQFQRGALPAMRERLRASALLRRTPGGWKFFVYAESPKSSMTYLRELYEAIVTPEFKAKVDAETKRVQ